ncbi:MAG: hypothetical protein HYX27_26990 [Acidobacteria bacterium]|nr:hypothetical protein [Acidobacteriota bacterium]
MRLLFASGNPEPQPEFWSDVRFWDRLALGDFRAALALRRPRVFFDAQGRPVSVRMETLRRVGRTPIPYGREFLQIQMKGREGGGDARRDAAHVRFSNLGVEIVYDYSFKLGRLADWAGALLTAKLAPFAWMELRYRVPWSGEANLSLHSSAVPSTRWYVEDRINPGTSGHGRAVGGADMERHEAVEFERFVDTSSEGRGPRVISLHKTVPCLNEAIRGNEL